MKKRNAIAGLTYNIKISIEYFLTLNRKKKYFNTGDIYFLILNGYKTFTIFNI